MQSSIITKALVAASANVIAHSQSLAGAGYLTLTATPVVLDSQRQIIVTSGGDDHLLTWTVIGTDDTGNPIQDSFAGANGVATSNLNFKTVVSIYGNGATASTVTAGTNTAGSSPWKLFDSYIGTPNLGLDFELLSGSATVNVEYTQEPFLTPVSTTGAQSSIANGSATPNPTAHAVPGMGNISASTQGNLSFPIHAWRLTILSGTGSTRLTGRQAGLVGG